MAEIWEIDCYKIGEKVGDIVPLSTKDLENLSRLGEGNKVRIDELPKEGAKEFSIKIKGDYENCKKFIKGLQLAGFSIMEEVWKIQGYKMGIEPKDIMRLTRGNLEILSNLANDTVVKIIDPPDEGTEVFSFKIKGYSELCKIFARSLPPLRFFITMARKE